MTAGRNAIDALLAELESRLGALGVRGRAARRVLAEARDHVRDASRDGEEQQAVLRFGDVDEIARRIAAELATAQTRRAAYGTFVALALAGMAYVFAFALVPAAGGWPDIVSGHVDAVGPISGLAMGLLPQVAFVSGCLAVLRAVRLRRTQLVSDAELRLVRRRSLVAIAAAAGTLAAMATYALNSSGTLAGWWTWTTVAACAALAVPLAAAAGTVRRSAVPAAAPGGAPGDVFDDLAPLFRLPLLRLLELQRHSWGFAALTAAAVGLVGLVAGTYAEGDPGSGLVRGGFEALALLVCFAVLGRTLGLRRSRALGGSMRVLVVLAAVTAAVVIPATGFAALKGKVFFEDTVPSGKTTSVLVVTHRKPGFQVLLRVPTAGRARLYLLGKHAPKSGALIDTKTSGCEGAAGSFYCKASYEKLPAGTYTWRLRWVGLGNMPAHVELTLRW